MSWAAIICSVCGRVLWDGDTAHTDRDGEGLLTIPPCPDCLKAEADKWYFIGLDDGVDNTGQEKLEEMIIKNYVPYDRQGNPVSPDQWVAMKTSQLYSPSENAPLTGAEDVG